MGGRIKPKLPPSLVRGCVAVGAAPRQLSVLVVSEDEGSHRTDIFEFTDFMQAEPPTIAFTEQDSYGGMWLSPSGAYFLSGVLGTAATNVSQKFVRTRVTTSKLFAIWGLSDEDVYTVGSEGACHRFDGKRWNDMSLAAKLDLHCIHGTSPSNLVAVGSGVVARWNGTQWTKVSDLPDALCVHVADDTRAYIGTRDGAFRLTGDKIERLEGAVTSYFAVTAWRGDIYFATRTAGLFGLEGDTLVSLRPQTAGSHLVATPDHLFVAGANTYARFDGADWKTRTFS
jgi:hypothetical protein